MRTVVFRADASVASGTGHVMRCLALADELASAGWSALFICRRLEGHIGGYIQARGHELAWLDCDTALKREVSGAIADDAARTSRIIRDLGKPPALLVTDHYAIDAKWESLLRHDVVKIMAIDDLADRFHDADLLLDQNWLDETLDPYRDLVPAHCLTLLGPKYLLLRRNFYEARQTLRPRDGIIRRVLIFFGGSDPTQETEKALEAWSSFRHDLEADVVVGGANPRGSRVAELVSELKGVRMHVQTDNMAALIASADYGLGAGGVALWERCYLGLPSSVTVVAENQTYSTSEADRLGAVHSIGWHAFVTSSHYRAVLEEAMSKPGRLTAMSLKGMQLTDSRQEKTRSLVASEVLAVIER
ncbi:UDP-2,4-diacetamido-2,4,6-trideoxy-beta-L-altropyranose hydrolase [Cohnella sp. OV330]|uniref:UDP-2,4-diacetamido-2,4, 6-trideoxy-beta-L-altropyranose hydrolase n=1 Tax=Cohnella sp. OV330 TaxID=1855288 RepID=UPI000A52656D|nr:UDP-2,4-diacetamido-2,4,6-trideoxy-beta-L-altropyranose hydrolase [Cohnella sp. OV330]